jgi:hypothetical protein
MTRAGSAKHGYPFVNGACGRRAAEHFSGVIGQGRASRAIQVVNKSMKLMVNEFVKACRSDA